MTASSVRGPSAPVEGLRRVRRATPRRPGVAAAVVAALALTGCSGGPSRAPAAAGSPSGGPTSAGSVPTVSANAPVGEGNGGTATGGTATGGTATGGTATGGSAGTPAASGTAAPGAAAGTAPSRSAARLAELPRGGRTLFPRYRLVGYSGAPGSRAFGRLGIGRLDDRVREIEKLARAYGKGRQPLPVLELIATVVQASPGRDGKYRSRMSPAVIGQYLAAARRHKALLLLNVQPGRARFLDEVRALERWLREPDVGLALDPEWAIGPGQVPGRVFGRMSGQEIDAVSRYVHGLVAQRRLPQKALVVHQLRPSIVTSWKPVRRRAGVVVVKSVDGIGSKGAKEATWRRLRGDMSSVVRPGFKLFFEEDREAGPLMTPKQVLALRPTPEYVLYE